MSKGWYRSQNKCLKIKFLLTSFGKISLSVSHALIIIFKNKPNYENNMNLKKAIQNVLSTDILLSNS